MNQKIIIQVDQGLEALIPDFLAHRQEDIERITMALQQQDFEQIRIIGHSMKGIGSSYGFDEITGLGSHLEQCAKINDGDAIHQYNQQLSDYLANIEINYIQ